jgi:SNF2 family DNA or RNA helicase
MKPLWAHQEEAIDFFRLNPSVFLMSDVGTGKTRAVLEFIRECGLPTLILCPKILMGTAWKLDIEEYTPELQYSLCYAEDRAEAMSSPARIKVMNVDGVTWLKANPKYLKQFDGGLLVIDESTAYKGYGSKRTKAAIEIAPIFSRKIIMSGSPAPQSVGDLWSQMMILDGGQRLGNSYYRFRSLCFSPVKKGNFTTWEEKPGVADAVASLISDITVRHKRELCMDIPDNTIRYIPIDISPSHRRKYEQLKRSACMELESGTVTAMNAATLANKLLQALSGSVYDESGVAHLVDTERYELVSELVDARDHTVVFYNWTHQKNELIKEADRRGFSYVVINGDVPIKHREAAVKDFQEGKYKVLYAQIQAASHGLTLTRATTTIFTSPVYNAEHFLQARARIWRGGQTKKTETILITTHSTIETKVYDVLFNKVTNLENLLEIL